MLTRIHLQNFRKHRDTELRVQHGLTVMRGNNEAGKSTIIEGICYALFGVKALRSSIDEAVTHGEPVNTLRVDANLIIDGVEYSVRRGKSGAEVNYDGGRVTGQTEVTSFLCGKLRVDPSSAAKLMLAGQNEIRGALEAGPKATAELIERLAEFDQIDLLVERMQERLSLGSTTSAQERLAAAEQGLADSPAPVEPDYSSMQAEVDALGARLEELEKSRQELEAKIGAAQAGVAQAEAAKLKAEQAEANLRRLRTRYNQVCLDLQAALHDANKSVLWPTPEETMRERLAQLDQAEETLRVWRYVQPSLAPVGTQVEASVAEVVEEIARQKKLADDAQKVVAAEEKKAAVARSQISTGSCSFCGQDFSHLPEVAKKNADLQASIESAELSVAQHKGMRTAAMAEVAELEVVLQAARAAEAMLKAYPNHVKAKDPALVPAELEWCGPDVEGLENTPPEKVKILADLKALQSMEAEVAKARARAEALACTKAELEADVSQAVQEVEAADLRPDLEAAREQLQRLTQEAKPLRDLSGDIAAKKLEKIYAIKDAERQHKHAVESRARLESEVETLKDSIKVTEFNNALLKRVRQCRPLIADQLWNIVLNAVSSYFSEMRGQQSAVTKDSEGFKVDGHGVASLSGSTLDILGLAIRVALVRTFLPNAPFMVLDEPCAAMDSQRTEATLGFIVACGFQQVIVVTHEDTSESVADSMIQVGE